MEAVEPPSIPPRGEEAATAFKLDDKSANVIANNIFLIFSLLIDRANKTNRTDRTNRINGTDRTDRTDRTDSTYILIIPNP